MAGNEAHSSFVNLSPQAPWFVAGASAFPGYILWIMSITFLSTLIPSSRYRARVALADAPEVRPCETCPRMALRSRSAWSWLIPRRRLNAFSLQYDLQYFESLRLAVYSFPVYLPHA